MDALRAAAQKLADETGALRRNFHKHPEFVFQPAEEIVRGAEAILFGRRASTSWCAAQGATPLRRT